MTGSAIVVGAGIFGVSIADHLAGAGWEVELVERYRPGHARQSSGGETRLIRYGHGEDAWYTALAWRARRLWDEIEEDTGADLLVRSGVVWFGADLPWVRSSHEVMRRLGIAAELVDDDALRRLFPSVDTSDLPGGLLEPDAGVLRAALAVEVLAGRAVRRGATLTIGRAEPDGAGVAVDGRRRGADVVVWACGPWLPRLFPDLVDVRVTRQEVVFVAAGLEWAAPGVPGWIDHELGTYGTGDVGGKGFKVGDDLDGPDFDPDLGERASDPAAVARARRFLATRFPALADAPVSMTRTCQYTSTQDGEWIVAPYPGQAGVWLVGAGSGHGFKHGPALGEYVARLIDGAEEPRPALGLGPRRPAAGLRTRQDQD